MNDWMRASAEELREAYRAVQDRLARPLSYEDRAADVELRRQLQQALMYHEYTAARERLADSDERCGDDQQSQRDKAFVGAYEEARQKAYWAAAQNLEDELLGSADEIRDSLTRHGYSVEDVIVRPDWAHPGGFKVSARLAATLSEITVGYLWLESGPLDLPDVRFLTAAERDSLLGVAESEDNPLEYLWGMAQLLPGLARSLAKKAFHEVAEQLLETIAEEIGEELVWSLLDPEGEESIDVAPDEKPEETDEPESDDDELDEPGLETAPDEPGTDEGEDLDEPESDDDELDEPGLETAPDEPGTDEGEDLDEPESDDDELDEPGLETAPDEPGTDEGEDLDEPGSGDDELDEPGEPDFGEVLDELEADELVEDADDDGESPVEDDGPGGM